MIQRISHLTLWTMSSSVLNKMLSKAELVEKQLVQIRSKLEVVKRIKIEEKINELTKENLELIAQVEKAKNELIRLETLNGKKQYALPVRSAGIATEVPAQGPEPVSEPAAKRPKEKKEKDAVKKIKDKPATNEQDAIIDVRKLEFRIGKIVDIKKHPDADSLYVEKIDCGEENPRTVVSGLVNHVPIEEMRDRIVMVLCNLKPVKMRGVTSEAMVMCASSPEKVEVLVPPNGAAPGDLVTCEGYPREPETILNPKKKIFETCAPDLKTNSERVACYKDKPLVVAGKGAVVAPTLKGVSVK